MMNWIAGGAIPDHSLAFLEEELMLDGSDRRAPEPLATRRSAIVIGAGMSGLLAAHRLRQPGLSSWYKNRHGRVSQNWPFPLVDYWQRTRTLDPEDDRLTPDPVRTAAQ